MLRSVGYDFSVFEVYVDRFLLINESFSAFLEVRYKTGVYTIEENHTLTISLFNIIVSHLYLPFRILHSILHSSIELNYIIFSECDVHLEICKTTNDIKLYKIQINDFNLTRKKLKVVT